MPHEFDFFQFVVGHSTDSQRTVLIIQRILFELFSCDERRGQIEIVCQRKRDLFFFSVDLHLAHSTSIDSDSKWRNGEITFARGDNTTKPIKKQDKC